MIKKARNGLNIVFDQSEVKGVEGFDITRLLADFILAMVILWQTDKQIKILQDQIKQREDTIRQRDETIKRLDSKIDDCVEEHRRDLRDWSGLKPQFETWKTAETDTKLRLTMEERERLRERIKPPD